MLLYLAPQGKEKREKERIKALLFINYYLLIIRKLNEKQINIGTHLFK